MTPSTRKLIGTIILLVFFIVYVLVAMSVTAEVLPGRHWVLQAAGYIFAALVWVPLGAILISWMVKERPGDKGR